MHVKAKAMAFGGLAIALSIVCMALGSVIESNTLFLLAAASYFVGIIIREFGVKTGAAFYAADVLLGLLIAPNKFYVLSYAAMGLYILLIEAFWRLLGSKAYGAPKRWLFWLIKYAVFNLLYIPALVLFPELFFSRGLSAPWMAGVLLAGQAGLFVYDQAYEYVQRQIWTKYRGKILL